MSSRPPESLAYWLAQVIAEPEADAPREAFADWIEYDDPAWAEMIRSDLTAARKRRHGGVAWPAGNRAEILQQQHGERWAGRIRDAVSSWAFHRGFVEAVTVDAEWFLETADELYDLAPILHLRLTDVKLVTEELFASPHLERIRSLNLIDNELGDDEAVLLADSYRLRGLRWLDLSSNRIGPAGLEALAATPWLPHLQYLGFRFNAVEDPTPQHNDEYDVTSAAARALIERHGPQVWLEAFPRRAWPPGLDDVDLGLPTDDPAHYAPALDPLYQRVLADPEADAPREAFADAVEASDSFRAEMIRCSLVSLHKRRVGNEDRPETGRALTLKRRHAHRWAGPIDSMVDGWSYDRGFVETVSIDTGRFLETADQLYALAPILHLNLTGVKPVIADLFASPHLARIRSLNLIRNGLGDDEVAVLAASTHLGRLLWLSLSNNRVGPAGLEALAASTGLPSLKYVDLSFNAVDDPTPQFADSYDATSAVARALMDRHGHRAWLDVEGNRREWPPAPDDLDLDLAP